MVKCSMHLFTYSIRSTKLVVLKNCLLRIVYNHMQSTFGDVFDKDKSFSFHNQSFQGLANNLLPITNYQLSLSPRNIKLPHGSKTVVYLRYKIQKYFVFCILDLNNCQSKVKFGSLKVVIAGYVKFTCGK